jgi:hypothetical protein
MARLRNGEVVASMVSRVGWIDGPKHRSTVLSALGLGGRRRPHRARVRRGHRCCPPWVRLPGGAPPAPFHACTYDSSSLSLHDGAWNLRRGTRGLVIGAMRAQISQDESTEEELPKVRVERRNMRSPHPLGADKRPVEGSFSHFNPHIWGKGESGRSCPNN